VRDIRALNETAMEETTRSPNAAEQYGLGDRREGREVWESEYLASCGRASVCKRLEMAEKEVLGKRKRLRLISRRDIDRQHGRADLRIRKTL
jgi:hypothetical protein